MKYFDRLLENKLREDFSLMLVGISFHIFGPANNTNFSNDTSLDSEIENCVLELL